MKEIVEIRWHSRAGQGAITASHALAEALGGEEGFFTQSFSEFGAEKRGAPVKVFTRIAHQEIEGVHQIENPHYIVLFDTTLINDGELSWNEVMHGLRGKLLINTSAKHLGLDEVNGEVWHLDATGIAMDEIGKDIPNVPLVAALLKISGLYPLDKFKKHLEKALSALPPAVIEGNLRAFERGAKEVFRV